MADVKTVLAKHDINDVSTIVRVILVAEEQLREIGVKIVDDDGNNAELQSLKDGSKQWIKL